MLVVKQVIFLLAFMVYADDIVLLAPRRHALQLLVDTFSSYAKKNTI